MKLSKRVKIAKEENSDLLVSIHNNAKGDIADYDHGCTVLTGRGVYRKKICKEEQKLACNLLYELSEIGLENQGILLRQSENGTVYENDALADYYAIIRNGLEQDVPSVIIEHAFVDSGEDYEAFLKNDQKLKRLAQADAKGIARYYSLQNEENEEQEQLVNVKEKLTLITDGKSGENQISYQIFYQKEEEATTQSKAQSETAGDTNSSKSLFEQILYKIKTWIKI